MLSQLLVSVFHCNYVYFIVIIYNYIIMCYFMNYVVNL